VKVSTIPGLCVNAMAKYQPLETHLAACNAGAVSMTFVEIEAVIGAKLPAAAHTHRSWWSNNAANNVMTRSWLAAGYRTERVDIPGQALTFRRIADGAEVAGAPPAPNSPTVLERLWANLAGTVRTPKLVELTDPVGDAWDSAL
jgi:hypothetical protein